MLVFVLLGCIALLLCGAISGVAVIAAILGFDTKSLRMRAPLITMGFTSGVFTGALCSLPIIGAVGIALDVVGIREGKADADEMRLIFLGAALIAALGGAWGAVDGVKQYTD